MKITHTFTKRQILFTLLTIVCVALIFLNSLQNGTNSSKESGHVVKLLESLFHSLGFPIAVSEHFIRKLAHFTEYTALGVLLGLTLRSYTERMMNHIFIPLFIGLAVPVTDEYIQSFVDGRGSMVQDVVLDFTGVCFGLSLTMLIILLKLSRNKKGKRN